MSKSRSTGARTSGPRGRNGVNGHLEVIPYRPHRTWWVQAVLLVWRWLFELLFIAAVTWVIVKVHDASGWAWTWSTLAVLAFLAFPFVIPPVRRVLMALFWVSVTRHRLRAFFFECRPLNRFGKLRCIVSALPTP